MNLCYIKYRDISAYIMREGGNAMGMTIGGSYGYSAYRNNINPVSGGENISPVRLKAMKRSGQVECETCASRKYKDGSDEADVSFKSAAHIDPSAAAGTVMAHEQEHVSNANQKAADKGGEVVSASVTLKTSTCPECGRAYVSGGVTNTAIRYPKNAYGQNQKSADYSSVAGQNINYAV